MVQAASAEAALAPRSNWAVLRCQRARPYRFVSVDHVCHETHRYVKRVVLFHFLVLQFSLVEVLNSCLSVIKTEKIDKPCNFLLGLYVQILVEQERGGSASVLELRKLFHAGSQQQC